VDKIDKEIVEIIKQNSKQGTKEGAAQVGRTGTQTYERIKR